MKARFRQHCFSPPPRRLCVLVPEGAFYVLRGAKDTALHVMSRSVVKVHLGSMNIISLDATVKTPALSMPFMLISSRHYRLFRSISFLPRFAYAYRFFTLSLLYFGFQYSIICCRLICIHIRLRIDSLFGFKFHRLTMTPAYFAHVA